METVIISGTSIVAQSVLSNAIHDIYTVMKNIKNKAEFSSMLDDLDLKVDIEITEALLKDVDVLKKNDLNVVRVCVEHIHEVLKSIKEEYDKINLKLISYHYSNSYKSYLKWDFPDYEQNKTNLKKYKEILNKRVDVLIKIMCLKNN